MTIDTQKLPKLLDKSISKVWIKDGKRKMMSDGGYTLMNAGLARNLFGKYKGGKYSLKYDN